MTIRELILELRKIGNHDALVQLAITGPGVRNIEAIETQDTIGKGNVIVYLRDHKETGGTVLSSSRRIVWQ
jgi:hypothetical protein